ncbi:MAG TPA: ABC transporter substrate-binding protein [Acidimicrobiales bacterium]|nr:ABC transporter substrate-binding protein [Acidimicrobiales bacterium]
MSDTTPNPTEPSEPSGSAATTGGSGSRTGLIIGLVAAAVVLIIGAIVVFGGGDDDDDVEVADDATTTTVADEDDEEEEPEAPTTTVADESTDTTAAGGGEAGDVPDGPTITIGAQDFGESAILAQVYGQALEAAGYPVSYQALGGFRDIVFASFESGDINFTAEYAASALEFLNEGAGEATGDIEPTAALLREYLAERGLQAAEASPAVDSNAFVVTSETADELGLSSIGDLTDDLRLGGPPDCETNAFCIPGVQAAYGVDLSGNFVSLDGGGPLTVAALEGGEIDVAILFSTNGQIAANDWVVLDDPEGLINADNVIPVMTDELVEVYGDDFVALVNEVSAALDTAQLTELNRRYDIDLEDADAIARDWLEGAGLL